MKIAQINQHSASRQVSTYLSRRTKCLPPKEQLERFMEMTSERPQWRWRCTIQIPDDDSLSKANECSK